MGSALHVYLDVAWGFIAVYIAIVPWILGMFTLINILFLNIQVTQTELVIVLLIGVLIEICMILYFSFGRGDDY
jgi:hypothetical protein